MVASLPRVPHAVDPRRSVGTQEIPRHPKTSGDLCEHRSLPFIHRRVLKSVRILRGAEQNPVRFSKAQQQQVDLLLGRPSQSDRSECLTALTFFAAPGACVRHTHGFCVCDKSAMVAWPSLDSTSIGLWILFFTFFTTVLCLVRSLPRKASLSPHEGASIAFHSNFSWVANESFCHESSVVLHDRVLTVKTRQYGASPLSS